jgi:predicted RNase H-like HicB family nuclease
MTLIEAYSRGTLIGRCDERCYDAECPSCHCICQGANHGVGLEQALANTRERHEEWKATERARRGKHTIRFVAPPVDQPNLWEGNHARRNHEV